MPQTLPDFDLDRYLPYRMTVIAARLSNDMAREYKEKFGISIPEWRVLLNLGYSGFVSIRDIEKRVNLEKSKVSRAASRLEAKGFLTKEVDAQDRRLLKLALTSDGIDLLSKLIPIATEYQDKLETALGDQTETLQDALDCLMRSTQTADASGPS
ncbi:MarR family winged helix-turn-helix transcriptional regulator [Aestuariibius sp. HNIBRBA575]|uniref:MarR family winged helix-turn-helix transcriptional regulator n=1 Tax=Aestuariibius sp. HNIBRBA575 TaxID=3233343 RepID=UPI0034A1EFD8